MTPEDADEEIADAVRATVASPAVPFDFDTYDDGTPILTDQENGDPIPLRRRQEVLRQYMRIHYRECRYVVANVLSTHSCTQNSRTEKRSRLRPGRPSQRIRISSLPRGCYPRRTLHGRTQFTSGRLP